MFENHLERFFEDDYKILYQAKLDGKLCLLKSLKIDSIKKCRTIFDREMQICDRLQSPYLLQYDRLIELNGELLLVYEWFDSIALRDRFNSPIELSDFLTIASHITTVLNSFHKNKYVLSYLTPDNILIEPKTNQIKLIDLFFYFKSDNFSHYYDFKLNPYYMAPELTERTSVFPDHRTDFYLFGIVLYQLATREYPSKGKDSAEIIHAQIAKRPIPPIQLNKLLPQAISDLIMKLLEKTPRSRYQTIAGLKSDIDFLQRLDKSIHTIRNFKVAMFDDEEALQLPEKLIGRKNEIDKISRSLKTDIQIFQIRGFHGIGKSKFIAHIANTSFSNDALLIHLNSISTTTPYGLIELIINTYLDHLLAGPLGQIQKFKELIGKKTALMQTAFSEHITLLNQIVSVEQNRPKQKKYSRKTINGQLFKLILDFSNELVICIDDMHFADPESIDLLQTLLNSSQSSELKLIYSYHPQSADLNINRKIEFLMQSCTNEIIELNEFTVDDINHYLNIIFPANNQVELLPLASLIHAKTMGFPKYVNELLQILHMEKLIKKNKTNKKWFYDISLIQQFIQHVRFTDILILRLEFLPAAVQQLLRYAACFGFEFSLLDMAGVTKIKINKLRDLLELAVQSQVIEHQVTGNKDVFYQFADKLILKEIYQNLFKGQRQRIHLKIARHFLKAFVKNSDVFSIAELTDHFNKGLKYISNQAEVLQVIRLNLLSAKRATREGRFKTAYNYTNICVNLIHASFWDDHYALAKEIYLDACSASHVVLNFNESLNLIDHSLKRIRTFEEKLPFFYIKAQIYIQSNRSQEAVELCLATLKEIGFKIPDNPSGLLIFANVYNVIFRIRLMGFKRLSELPENNNQHSQDIIRFIFLIITQIYYTNPRLIPFMIAIMIKQSLIHGITLYSPAAMVMLSSFLINIAQRDVGFAFHLADTAVELSNRFNENKLIASEFLKINFVDYWRQPLSTINQFLLPLYDQSISSGEYEYGALALVTFCNNAFYDGVKLAELNETISQLKMKVLHVKQEMSLQELNSLQQMIQVLIAQTYSPIETPEFIETDEHSNRTMKCKFYMMNMVISYFLENYDDAIQNSKLSYLYIDSLSLGPLNILFHFFSSLSYLSHTNLPERQKVIRKKLFTLIKFRKKMQFNFKPFQMILLAKWLSYKGKSIPAYRILKKLINDPENRSNYFTTALTYEEAAKLLAKSNPDLSQFYYLKAHMAYTEWGASFKAKQIKEKYLQQYDLAKSTEINSSNSIDILSILKASETLSREVRINDLLLKLLNILMENSGAQRCRLILNENGKLMGRAVCCSKERDERIIYDPIEGNDSYPSLMIHEVFRTELQIVLEDASHSKFSYTDPYILKNQSKSILVYPIKSQNGIQAILLLENDLIAGAFNSERLSLLNILSSQIAISLENARLYETLEDKVESRMQDLKRTQKQLIQAEKMSSLGVLTAGIAHEMNTPLAYVKNNFILVNRMIQDGNLNEQKQTSINKLLNDCEYGITKVSEIVKGLKDFSRKDDDSMQRISLADILQQALIIGQNLIKKHQILLESNIEKSVMIDCYPVQLEQVFLNIINNSCYALSKRKITNSDQSRIKISCTKKTSHLLISFWDNGNGIDPELVSNIFDPFFTTKEVGEGTGLGLSICYNIIKAHHGNIRVNSDGKSFTEFLIKLPLAKIPETSELVALDH